MLRMLTTLQSKAMVSEKQPPKVVESNSGAISISSLVTEEYAQREDNGRAGTGWAGRLGISKWLFCRRLLTQRTPLSL